MRVGHGVSASAKADFEIEGIAFEIDGRNKTSEQLAGIENGYIVKDDIEHGHGNVIPLWAFGLCY